MKIIGSVSWTCQPGYPKLVNDDGKEELQVNYLLTEDELTVLPEIRSPFIDSRYPMFLNLGVYLTRRTLSPKPGLKVWLLEMIYTTPENSLSENPDVKRIIEFDTEEYEEPLEACENYRTCWKYVLLRADNCSDAVPSFWEEAKDTKISSAFSGKFRWALPSDPVPDGWHILAAETKQGVTGRLTGAGIVTVTMKSSSKSALEAKMQGDFTIETPPDAFGLSGEWLRCGTSMREEGSKWVSVVKYRNAAKVDKDLYGEKK